MSSWSVPGLPPESAAVSAFTVYRIDPPGTGRTPVGTLVERRQSERGNNIAGLLRLAISRYKRSSDAKFQVDFRGIRVEF